MTYEHKTWNSSSNNNKKNNNNNNTRNATQALTLCSPVCLFIYLFIYLFHISIPHLSQSHSSLHEQYSTHFPFLLLFLPFRGCLTLTLLTWRIWWASNNASKWQMGFNSAFKGLMDVIQWRFLPQWRSQNVRTHWQECHIFTTWKNLEWWASWAEIWGTPEQRYLKPIKPGRVEFLIAFNVRF
jgi:hypothetical protein